jgi:hypothetical protein
MKEVIYQIEDSVSMSYLRYVPVICIAGALIGFFALTQLWVHHVDGFDWSVDLTGIDLMNSPWDGFQANIPVIVAALSGVTIVVAILNMTVRRFWFGPFVALVLGIAIMILTSLFSMWTIGPAGETERIVHFADIGFWLSYVTGGVIILGVALQYSVMFRKPVKTNKKA